MLGNAVRPSGGEDAFTPHVYEVITAEPVPDKVESVSNPEYDECIMRGVIEEEPEPPPELADLMQSRRLRIDGDLENNWYLVYVDKLGVPDDCPLRAKADPINLRGVVHQILQSMVTPTLPTVLNAASLPTTNPHVVGQLWVNSGVVTVSAG